MNKKTLIKGLPLHAWLGLGLIIVYWYANWCLPSTRTALAFFPMWLGYCLLVDGLVYLRKGTSLLTRSSIGYIKLFLFSAPGWWLFELINWRTQNWCYNGREYYTDFQYFVLASLCFSTVMPAVFGTAELAGTFGWLKRMSKWTKISYKPKAMIICFILGWALLALLLLWPLYFFGFIWISVLFILEPINVWLKHRTLFPFNGDWRQVVALGIGCLICSFFWEMWNIYSYPKWVYHVPFVGFLHIFEMPLLGYLGYIPFAWELFVLYHLITGLFKQAEHNSFIQLIADSK